MENISGFGLIIQLQASITFPFGLTLTKFADDADPLDLPSIQIGDKAMGLNGDLIWWNKATPIPMTLNMIPNTDDDENLGILLEANRVGRGKISAQDVINVTAIYPDGSFDVLQNGFITDGMPGTSIASSSRMKSKIYTFAFENKA